jgi:hypothetical protein
MGSMPTIEEAVDLLLTAVYSLFVSVSDTRMHLSGLPEDPLFAAVATVYGFAHRENGSHGAICANIPLILILITRQTMFIRCNKTAETFVARAEGHRPTSSKDILSKRMFFAILFLLLTVFMPGMQNRV